tara:strand:+ start:37 stop:276 length:240 start_codon:yes stop_codon:yes gene_type:complete
MEYSDKELIALIIKQIEEINKEKEDDKLISENQVSELLNVSKVTLNKWRSKDILKKNIHYIKIGRSLRYKKSAIINFDS